MADDLTFDFDAVTPRMLVDFKSKTGTDLMALADGDEFDLTNQTPEVLAGFIWLALRTSGRPDTTWDEALDTPFAALSFAEPEGEPDPTSAGSDS